MLKNTVKSVGAGTQPCFTPFVILKDRERMLLCLAVMRGLLECVAGIEEGVKVLRPSV